MFHRRASEPENIQAFNVLTLDILNKLYKKFPEPEQIDGLRYTIEMVLDHPTNDKKRFVSYFPDTMRWLREERFVRYDQELSGSFHGVTLTLTGLNALSKTPSSLGKKTPIIAKIRAFFSNGAKKMTADIASNLVKDLLKAMVLPHI